MANTKKGSRCRETAAALLMISGTSRIARNGAGLCVWKISLVRRLDKGHKRALLHVRGGSRSAASSGYRRICSSMCWMEIGVIGRSIELGTTGRTGSARVPRSSNWAEREA